MATEKDGSKEASKRKAKTKSKAKPKSKTKTKAAPTDVRPEVLPVVGDDLPPPPVKQPGVSFGSKSIPIEIIVDLYRKGYTNAQIARACGCSPANISIRLKRFLTQLEGVDAFKKHEADIITLGRASAVKKIVEMDDDDWENVSAKDAAGIFEKLYKAGRLADDKSTENIAIKSVNEYEDLMRENERLKKEIEKLDG